MLFEWLALVPAIKKKYGSVDVWNRFSLVMLTSLFLLIFGGKSSGEPEMVIPDIDTSKVTAFEIADHIGKSIASRIHPGVRTMDVDSAVDSFLSKNNIAGYFRGYNKFPKVVSVSINDEVTGGIPSDRKLEEGDLVKVETGVRHNGQCAYFGWTFPIGAISKERTALLVAAQNALNEGCNAVRAGQPTSVVTKAIDSSVRAAGFAPNRDFVGYRIGSSPHNLPAIPGSADTSMEIGEMHEGETYVILVIAHAGNPWVFVKGDLSTVVARDHKDSVLVSRTVTVSSEGSRVESHAGILYK